MKPKAIIILILFVPVIIVLLQNTQVVTLQLLFWKVQMSRVIFIPVIFAIGLIVGFVLCKIRSRSKLKRKESQNINGISKKSGGE